MGAWDDKISTLDASYLGVTGKVTIEFSPGVVDTVPSGYILGTQILQLLPPGITPGVVG